MPSQKMSLNPFYGTLTEFEGVDFYAELRIYPKFYGATWGIAALWRPLVLEFAFVNHVADLEAAINLHAV